MYGMNAGTDVLNLQMDGKPVTGQDSLYASAVMDAPTGEVILKLVNAGRRSEKVPVSYTHLDVYKSQMAFRIRLIVTIELNVND